MMSATNGSLKKILFVGGKGGVGKTTISSAIALNLSEKAKTLLVSTDPAHSIADSLEQVSVDVIANLPDTALDFWELNAQKAYDDFMDKHEEDFRLILDTSTYLDESDIDQFIGLTIPGIDEIMGFKAIVDLVRAEAYEYYVVDTAPTGHALRLLFIPEMLDNWIRQIASLRWKYREVQKTFRGKYTPDAGDDMMLDLKKSVLKMKSLLKDHEKSEFVMVSKPERMVVAESEDLKQQLEAFEMAINRLVINNIMEDHPCKFCQHVRKEQAPWIHKLEAGFSDMEVLKVRQYPYPISGLERIKDVSRQLVTIN